MTNSHSSFVLLPTETIEQIASHLTLEELRCLRLTCTTIAETTAYHFGYTYFVDARTNFSRVSIDRLEELSRSSFNKHVKYFLIEDKDEEAGRDVHWDRNAFGFIPANPLIVQQLCTILRRFINCQKVEVDIPSWYHKAHHPSRPRKISSIEMLSLAFLLVADSALPLQRLSIAGTGLSVIEQIQTCQTSWLGLQGAISQLKDLSLSFHIGHQDYECIFGLLSQGSNLEKLELRISYIRMICLPTTASSNLRKLKLFGLRMVQPNLLKFLLQCRNTLKTLRLFAVRLEGSWKSIFHCLEEFDQLRSINIRDLKQGISFRAVLFHYQDLEEKQGEMSKIVGGEIHLHVRSREWEGRRVLGVVYKGPCAKHLFPFLAASIVESR